jgi:hydrogenase maturation factor
MCLAIPEQVIEITDGAQATRVGGGRGRATRREHRPARRRGRRSEMMTGLVQSVVVRDLVLVHAGATLLRLGPDPAFREAR